MNIKKKLAIKFAFIVASILLMSSLIIYLSSAQYRKNEFNGRLKNKAINTAKLLIEVNEVDKNLLKIIDRNIVALPSEKVIIYNFRNEEIYNSKDEKGDSIPKELLEKIRLEKEVFFSEGEREVAGILYADKYDRFVVLASAVDRYGISKLKNLRLVLILVFFINVAITIVGGWIFASQALKPISNVVAEVKNISASNLHARVFEGNRKDEIAQLAITFNQMLERLEHAFNIQKSFVANASHELRTPLTAVTSQIEVALIKKRSPEEYEQVLQSILEDVKHLSNLYNGLLQLAQMDLDNRKILVRPVRIDEILLETIEELKEAKKDYNISFLYDLITEEDEKLTLLGSETLLKSAMINLIDNACKFSNQKQAKVTLAEIDDQLKIKIEDKGIGISEEDLKLIRQPFYRAENALKIKGHGLGLSLTEKIIKIHNGKMKIESAINRGTTVTVLFQREAV